MLQEGTEPQQDRKESLTKILNYKENPETVQEEVIKSMLQRSSAKVSQEIIHGEVKVFDPNNIIQEVSRLRERRKKLQSILQKLDIATHQQEVKALKRQIIKLKMEEGELTKKEAKIKTKGIVEKVKKWEEIQEEIRSKKEKQEQARLKQMNEELLQQKKEEAKLQKAKRQQKKRQIAQKLKNIEQFRLKRQQIIKFSQDEYSKLHPKYLQIENKYKKLEQEIAFQKDIFKKNHKLNHRIDHNAIKQHEKNYMTQVQQRIQKRKSLKSSQAIVDHDFTPFLYRSQDKISQQKQKLKRRREFQKKLKELPIEVSQQKKMKIEIARDKGKNPLKYHFLSQKALDDQKIYGQFQDFQIKTNPRQLGKQYLKELPNITQGSRVVTKSQSLNTLSERIVSQSERYKDYLRELKSQRGPQSEVTDEQLVSSMLRSGSQHKSKLLERLDERSRKYELQTLKRREQLQGYNNLQSSLKKSKQLDQVYVKSLKAKLACIEVKD